jgi:periplasmic divalent cation tolerance protein
VESVTDKIVVFSSCESPEEGRRLARGLVERRLAACVTVIEKGTSYYWWQGAIEEAGEAVLVIKSTRGKFVELREALQSMHSYQVPEVIAVPVADGSEAYLNWMERELGLQMGDES